MSAPINTEPRWFPRRLRVRIDAEIVVPDDRFASRELGSCVEYVVRQAWFQDGAYERGHVERFQNTTIRLTWSNRYGATWYWQLYNWVRRSRPADWWREWKWRREP